ncbi:MAG: transposase [Polyangiaceae bacterium]|nr:transposase [Polyangiaceae bacterium]
MGRSRGGVSTKLHAVVDTQGRPLHLTLSAGQRHEMMMADELLAQAHGKAVIADAGYDSNRFRAAVRSRGMKSAKLIAERPVAPRQLLGERVSLLERVERHRVRVETVMGKAEERGLVVLPLGHAQQRAGSVTDGWRRSPP